VTPSLRMMEQAVGLSGPGERIRTSTWWIGSMVEIGHSPIRDKRSNLFSIDSHKLLETFEFREPYGSSRVQRFGEKRALRRKKGNLPNPKAGAPIGNCCFLWAQVPASPPREYLAAVRLAEGEGFELSIRICLRALPALIIVCLKPY
jgi:hypothetical protein